MNKQNILQLTTLLETLPNWQFSMNTLTHNDCGSPACIAGWAAWLQLGKPGQIKDTCDEWNSGNHPTINAALEFFGTEDTDFKIRNELFRGSYRRDQNDKLSRKQAIRTLRHLAETGQVDWSA